MKLPKTFLKFAAPVIALLLAMPFTGYSQTVTYTAKNSATATATIGTTQVTDISNNGATVVRLDDSQTPVVFPMMGMAETVVTPVLKPDGSYDVTYTLNIQNYGALDLTSVNILDDLAATFATSAPAMTFTTVSATASGVSAGSALTINTGFNGSSDKNLLVPGSSNLLINGNGTITLVINVKPNGHYGTFNNTPVASGKTPDAVMVTDASTNNASPIHSDAANTPVEFNDPTPIMLNPSDLQVVKTVDFINPNVNTNVIFTIKTKNLGTGDAAPVTVNDLLPAGYSYVSHNTSTGTYDPTTGAWAIGMLTVGTEVTLTVTAKVLPNKTAAEYKNTASSDQPGDPVSSNNTSSADVVPVQIVDLAITNNDGKGMYIPGTTNTYTMVVNNNGPSDATGAMVTNTLPSGVTGTWTAVYTGGASGTAAGTNSINETVNIPVGGTITYTYIVSVPSGTTGNFVNTATVTAPTGVTDSNTANNNQSDTDMQNSQTDLQVQKSVNDIAPPVGDTVTFTVQVLNNGPSDATGVKVTDLLKAGYTFVDATPTTGTYNNLTGIWNIGNLANAAPATLTVSAKVNAAIAIPGYDNIAVVTGNETDPDLTNNTATVTTVPVPTIDLAISQTVSNPTPNVGSNVTFTITVDNNGPNNGTGINVADLLPPGFTFVSATPAAGTYNSTTGVWDIGNMANGSSATMTIVARVNPDFTATGYTNTAVVSGSQNEEDLTNNTSAQLVTPVPLADLKIVKTVSKTTPSIGTQVTFTLAVTNNGPSKATNVNVTDLLPAGFTYVSSAPSTGTYDNGTGIWTIGTVTTTDHPAMDVVAKVNPSGNYTNIATIAGTETDPDLTNNTSQVTITAKQLPVANNDAATTNPATPVVITVLGNDVKADANLVPSTVTVITPAQHGTVTIDPATGKATYTPDAGFYGTDVFTYTVTDANGGTSNVATVTITVNKPPVANDDSAVTKFNMPIGINIIANDVKGDANLVPSTVTVIQQPLHGTVIINPATGLATYTPNNGYFGTDNFTYTIKDANGAISNVANVTITVPKPPTANNDAVTTNLNTPVAIDILTNDNKGDSDLDPSTVTVISQPSHGKVTIDPVTGKATYTPDNNYFGNDTFTYTITDKNGNVSNVATVTIKINDTPVIGLAKSLVSAVKTTNGSFDVTYTLTVGNYGIIAMNNISIRDDLSQTFNSEQINVTGIKTLGKLTVNNNYNGSSNIEMLQTGNTLAVGQVEKIQVLVNVRLNTPGKTYLNSAFAEGTSAGGTKATDQSTDGLKPDPNKTGDVSPSTPTPVEIKKPKEFIPGGFSPNNDGTNDRFVIENTGLRKISIEIYNRWGNRVYRSNDYKNDWDGKCTEGLHIGEDVPEGTYFYIVVFDGVDRNVGYITINR